uniref:Glycosyltransferase family 92 protein n=1 Tax=Kalanchoe fedtschenkoi TaxID=63787 RepID=A0A7N0V7R7_KALFE
MGRKFRTALLSVFCSVLIMASISLFSFRHPATRVIAGKMLSPICDGVLPTESILHPDWDILLLLTFPQLYTIPETHHYRCLFQNNATSPAKRLGVLPHGRVAFKCAMPGSVRRIRPFYMPYLITTPDRLRFTFWAELTRWTFLAYDWAPTENDVVVFAKGVNRRIPSRAPDTLSCVFTNGSVVFARTAVSSSSQEVFRCAHPPATLIAENPMMKVSIEIHNAEDDEASVIAPSVAFYSPPPYNNAAVASMEPKRLLCATTMLRNSAKFLKEWVMYHSAIGVEKFILYDNESDDKLAEVVEELNGQGHNVTTVFWPWAKTQEAGFSHSAIHANDTCEWMMFLDVDEFVLSPNWLDSPRPSPTMLKSLLPNTTSSSQLSEATGQIMFRCHDFGPSNQTSHPAAGVTQGYTCRLSIDERHKSITNLRAIDHSLRNEIHHFQLKPDRSNKRLELHEGVVNHYKYQAWPEFKTKFKRRVSAYVVDWRERLNLNSRDRTPELGFEATEPPGWPLKFCEKEDRRLQMLVRKWFGSGRSPTRFRMAWQT